MLADLNELLRIGSTTLVALVCLFLIRNYKRGLHTWTAIGFTISIICYLLVEADFVDLYTVIGLVVITGAIVVPVFFWLLAKAMFDDHFRFTPRVSLWFLVLAIPRFTHLFLVRSATSAGSLELVVNVVSEIISIGFLLAGVYAAFRNKQDDLIESRLRFRSIFILTTATLMGITVIVEIATIGRESPMVLQVLQRASILALTAYFLINNFDIRPGFFLKDLPRPKITVPEDAALHAKLLALFEDERKYRKEGLTIRQLAEVMNEQEYRIRRVINGQLGFKNFNDFLNQYRIKEACEVLADPHQNKRTILEIAYDLGYQSIGPFNKAFRELKGTTPTAFRKASQS
jgi:AraC-like DNA-binding protein